MRHVPTQWKTVPPSRRAKSSSAASSLPTRPGRTSSSTRSRKAGLAVDLAQHADAGDDACAIAARRRGSSVSMRGVVERIGARDLHAAARLGMALPHRGGEARVAVQRVARLVHRQRHDVELHVGTAARGVHACTRRRRPGPRRRSAARAVRRASRQPMRGELQRIAHVVVERVALSQPHDGAGLVVVLQVLARPRADRQRPRCRAGAAESAGPMPESCSSCGDLQGAADRITSRSARARLLRPRRDPFDADGACRPRTSTRVDVRAGDAR